VNVISVHNVGVRYTIRAPGSRTVQGRMWQWLRGQRSRPSFWALRHVSLEVREHEAVALLGGNGAGKSTLCRVLAQILPPDEGHVAVRGRTVPLLAVGAGIRATLTGRENLMLAGTLMGLTRQQVRALTPHIVEFAELGEFIDQPVRTYSSGMRARLAFALATSIEPDVLIIDEALSVGDAYFKQKCRQRLQELIQRARAIVLVSHSIETVQQLCARGVWLHRGEVVQQGPIAEVADRYKQWHQSRLAQRAA
jgi:ABC-type polysaccharide/polyol phosphate transport system ATPase subunit